MAIEEKATRNRGGRGSEPAYDPSRGYVRIRFLNLRLWQILLLTGSVLAVALVVFPRHKRLVSFYMEKGMPEKALGVMQGILEEDPNDTEILALSSKVYLQTGDADAAIAALERILETHPQDRDVLQKLAVDYEWNRDPKNAMRAWERLSAVDPGNGKVLARLIQYYRYYGLPEKEVDTVARLFRTERDRPPAERFAYTEKPLPADTLSGDPLFQSVTRSIGRLLEQREEQAHDPYLDELIRRLYLVRVDWMNALAARERPDEENRQNALTAAMDLFAITGFYREGMAFAGELDASQDRSIENRLRMVTVMKWNGLHDQALETLLELARAYPQNGAVAEQLVVAVREKGRVEDARRVYATLVRNEPGNREYRMVLARLLMTSGDVRGALSLYERPVSTPDASMEDVLKLLAVAEETGRPVLMAETADQAVRFGDGEKILRKRIALYLAVDRPAEAYGLYKILAGRDPKRRDDTVRMLAVAGDTNDQRIMTEAVETAATLFPQDQPILSRAADMYLWMEKSKEAYRLYRRLALLSGGEKGATDRMIETAGYTDQPGLVREALLTAQRLRPKDPLLRKRVANAYLAAGDEKNAIKAFESYLRQNPGDVSGQKRLVDLYLWNDRPRDAFERMTAMAVRKGRDKKILMEAARIAEQGGLIEEAYGIYEQLNRSHPEDTAITVNLVRLASWTRREKEAAKWLAELSDRDPRNVDRALAAGEALMDAGDPRGGLVYLERAGELEPGRTDLRRRLASAYERVGKTDEMIRELAALDERGMLEPRERLILAQAYLDRKEGKKALGIMVSFEREPKLGARKGIMLATAYELSGKPEAAVGIYKRLEKEHGDDPRFLAALGNRALWLNRTDMALGLYEKALKLDPKNLVALKGSGQVYAWNNDPARAIERFEYYNRLHPEDYEVRFQLGELYYANEREGQAFREYKKTMALIKEAEQVHADGEN